MNAELSINLGSLLGSGRCKENTLNTKTDWKMRCETMDFIKFNF